jgi:enamine deaminase RidA (YjgF/YER057c/UK114 family)
LSVEQGLDDGFQIGLLVVGLSPDAAQPAEVVYNQVNAPREARSREASRTDALRTPRHRTEIQAVVSRFVPRCAALMCGTCTMVSSRRWLSKTSPQGHLNGSFSAAAHIAYFFSCQSRAPDAHYPAMALVQVVRLVEKSARVEIEATAVVPR